MEPEYPFEWGGIFALEPGNYELFLKEGPDPTIDIVVLPVTEADGEALKAAEIDAVLLFSDEKHEVKNGGAIRPEKRLFRLRLAAGENRYSVTIDRRGSYALFTQHLPSEFQLQLRGPEMVIEPALGREYKPDHEHNEEITSVGIEAPGDLDGNKFNAWMRIILMEQGQDIFRMKGVLSIKGESQRFVFQGVHMLFDAKQDRPWDTEQRRNSLIFIGRNLNRRQLNEGFRACLD